MKLKSEEKGTSDLDDNQISPREIEEALIRALRSGIDRIYFISDKEVTVKSINENIERFSSFGSIGFDSYSSALLSVQHSALNIQPSQKSLSRKKLTKEKL